MTHLEDHACSFECGALLGGGGGGAGIKYMKRKRASSNNDTHNSVKNRSTQRMAFRGTITLFAVKEYYYKLQRQNGPVCNTPGVLL